MTVDFNCFHLPIQIDKLTLQTFSTKAKTHILHLISFSKQMETSRPGFNERTSKIHLFGEVLNQWILMIHMMEHISHFHLWTTGFYINKSWRGCKEAAGWPMVTFSNDLGGCPNWEHWWGLPGFEAKDKTQPPFTLYTSTKGPELASKFHQGGKIELFVAWKTLQNYRGRLNYGRRDIYSSLLFYKESFNSTILIP